MARVEPTAPSGGRPAAELARRIARSRLGRLPYLGDVYESGTAREFEVNFGGGSTARWPGGRSRPPDTTTGRSGASPLLARVLRRPVPSYGADRLGGWEILSLNSEEPHGPGSRQLRWLRGRVSAGGTCRLAFWHRPRYSAGSGHGDLADMEPLWRLFANTRPSCSTAMTTTCNG